MAKYECKVCGYIYNEQHAGRSFSEINECPICNESKDNFFKLDAEENNTTTQVVNKVEEVKEDSSIYQSAPFISSVAEEKVADAVEKAVSVTEEKVSDVVDEATPVVENNRSNVAVETKTEDTPEFVVERRQEFWSPFSGRSQSPKVESTNTTGWTISSARTSVETVLNESGEKKVENITSTTEKVEEEMPAYESRIEHFYSSAEAVSTSHIVSEEKETFKPLWNTTGGTVQRVIDPFGDKKEPVVKAENIDMVVPAEEPIVEEILGEEPEEILEEVKEEAVTEETVVNEVAGATIEEAVVEETFVNKIVEEAAQEVVAEETSIDVFEEKSVSEAVEEVTAEASDEQVVEEVKETITTEEAPAVYANGYNLWNDEEDDDDFFTEVTLDAVVEDVQETKEVEVVTEDAVEDERSFLDEEEIAPEFLDEEPVVAEDTMATEESTVEEAVGEPAAEETTITEAIEGADVEDAEVVEESVAEETEAVTAEEVEETVAEEIEEIVSEENAELVEEPVEEDRENGAPIVTAWSFLDDIVEASAVAGAGAAGVAGVTFVTKAMDEVVEAEVTEDDIEEVFVDFGDENVVENVYKTNLAEELFGAQPVSEPEAEETVEVAEEDESTAATEVVEETEVIAEEMAYNNNLEKILILPAQLNPMPLPADTYVESRTILGIASEKPLVLDSPVFTSGMYNMVQYIPNTGLTSEDYQNADAIEIIVGHGNGIEKTINSKEDLRQVVNFLRLEADGCPIGIKLGAARIERDLEFCIFAKPDYVVLNNFSVVPLPYALHRAMKFLNTVQSDIDIVIALDGVKDAEELAKVFAMGADLVALRNQPANMEGLVEDLKQYARITGHYDVEDLNVKDLCTTDREIAEYTDIYHV